MITQSFHITGLHCKSCEALTKNIFNEFGGVAISDIQVNSQEGLIILSYEWILDIASVQNELMEMGYMLDITPIV